jgi:hypothetical protein
MSPNMMLNLPPTDGEETFESMSEHEDQAIFDCFSPTHEPLAIHFLHEIIFIEASLNQLNNTLDLLSNNQACKIKNKFPAIAKEYHTQLDFMQKIQYIDTLVDQYNQTFL